MVHKVLESASLMESVDENVFRNSLKFPEPATLTDIIILNITLSTTNPMNATKIQTAAAPLIFGLLLFIMGFSIISEAHANFSNEVVCTDSEQFIEKHLYADKPLLSLRKRAIRSKDDFKNASTAPITKVECYESLQNHYLEKLERQALAEEVAPLIRKHLGHELLTEYSIKVPSKFVNFFTKAYVTNGYNLFDTTRVGFGACALFERFAIALPKIFPNDRVSLDYANKNVEIFNENCADKTYYHKIAEKEELNNFLDYNKTTINSYFNFLEENEVPFPFKNLYLPTYSETFKKDDYFVTEKSSSFLLAKRNHETYLKELADYELLLFNQREAQKEIDFWISIVIWGIAMSAIFFAYKRLTRGSRLAKQARVAEALRKEREEIAKFKSKLENFDSLIKKGLGSVKQDPRFQDHLSKSKERERAELINRLKR